MRPEAAQRPRSGTDDKALQQGVRAHTHKQAPRTSTTPSSEPSLATSSASAISASSSRSAASGTCAAGKRMTLAHAARRRGEERGAAAIPPRSRHTRSNTLGLVLLHSFSPWPQASLLLPELVVGPRGTAVVADVGAYPAQLSPAIKRSDTGKRVGIGSERRLCWSCVCACVCDSAAMSQRLVCARRT